MEVFKIKSNTLFNRKYTYLIYRNKCKKIFCRLSQFFGKHKVTTAFNRKKEKKYTNRKRSVKMGQRIQRKEF